MEQKPALPFELSRARARKHPRALRIALLMITLVASLALGVFADDAETLKSEWEPQRR